MSQENVEIVRRLIEAWSNHDREEMAGYLHPDAVFHSAITNVVGETFHGRDQILGVFDRWEKEWSDIRWEVEEYIDCPSDRRFRVRRMSPSRRPFRSARVTASGFDT